MDRVEVEMYRDSMLDVYVKKEAHGGKYSLVPWNAERNLTFTKFAEFDVKLDSSALHSVLRLLLFVYLYPSTPRWKTTAFPDSYRPCRVI